MSAPVAARRLSLRTRSRPASIVVGVLGVVAAWEVAAAVMRSTSDQGDRVVPSWTVVLTDGLRGLSNYWSGGFGIESTAAGGPEGYPASVLALVAGSLVTIGRVAAGLGLAVAVGILLGLLVAACRPVRLSVSGIAEMMRMLPALAMAPLFTLWFGVTSTASVAFIVFSVSFIVLLATVNAVANLPDHVVDYPRTLGVRGSRLWFRVVLPAALPEMRGSIVFAGLVAWTTVLASEMYGMQSGLGWMLADTLRFSLVERMVVVAVVFSGFALATMKLLGAGVSALTRWAE